MSNRWIYELVHSLVEKYQTRDPEQLAEELNVKIRYFTETESLLGMYKVILRNRFIFIPTNLGPLKKTVLAHELGHDQMHREYCKNGASFHENKIFNPTNQYEIEANIFAAHLLIPDEEVRRLIKYANSDRELAAELEVDINLLHLKISEMAKMNLLDLDQTYLERPDSQFLKDYQRLDEWDEH